ncbi:MAG: hypothetical protein PHG80_09695 [Methanoregulaceae archaeon]|nr:hypothetical protein [Methanoregulaceae archaeon]
MRYRPLSRGDGQTGIGAVSPGREDAIGPGRISLQQPPIREMAANIGGQKPDTFHR